VVTAVDEGTADAGAAQLIDDRHVLQLDGPVASRDELEMPDRDPAAPGDEDATVVDVGVELLGGVFGFCEWRSQQVAVAVVPLDPPQRFRFWSCIRFVDGVGIAAVHPWGEHDFPPVGVAVGDGAVGRPVWVPVGVCGETGGAQRCRGSVDGGPIVEVEPAQQPGHGTDTRLCGKAPSWGTPSAYRGSWDDQDQVDWMSACALRSGALDESTSSTVPCCS
jgi:hypothetical protein